MTEFLTYELLTPEDANPVIIRITSQRERGFEDFRASNGVRLASQGSPRYYELENALYARGACEHMDDRRIEIPRADWPLVKVAIAELNEAKKEKGDMKEDRYEFPLDEWDAVGGGNALILTRKKPKVTVEWGNCSRFGDGLGESGIDFSSHGYGKYHIVQFRVTGWEYDGSYDLYFPKNNGRPGAGLSANLTRQYEQSTLIPKDLPFLYIGLDARDKWSAPVLLPEEIYNRLPEICKALEDRANGGKG